MKRAVILFTRVPVPGQTKTRMMPYLTPKQCAKLHTCFLKDIIIAWEQCGADLFVCYTPAEGLKELQKILGKDKQYFPQEGEGLGEKMFNAFAHVFQKNYRDCVLIGSDVPEIQSEHLKKAFEELQNNDVVLGATKDGGYYLAAMNKIASEMFQIQEYGHEKVFQQTVKVLKEAGYRVGYTAKLQDMDTPDDLGDFRKRMRKGMSLKDSNTGRYLAKISKISIIIPLYNEVKTIEKMQAQLRDLIGNCEIIFVDGGSTDGTLKKVSPEFTLLHSPKGRAKQMNMGAKVSSGDILFFLHCDSELPEHPLAEIRRVMQSYEAGCFGIAFHSLNFFMLTCRVISNHRIKDRKVMFGDQGIFMDRGLFFEAGMFPELPIMEDYQFSLTLKEKGVALGMTKRRIYTSARRFPKGTVPKLKIMWKMNRLRKAYRDGVSIENIAKMYRDIR